jgi:1,4-dihydroxy-6-naphthoate synthase
LNHKAFNSELDIIKVSFAAYLHLQSEYLLLNSGSALGSNCGPLLISKKIINPEDIASCTIAIPGNFTTANFLFNIFFPHHGEKKEMMFSDIEKAVLDEITDVGVIIHENRFTYQQKGLKKVADLGELWEFSSGYPIPLGGIALKRSIPLETATIINILIRESVLYAFAHPDEAIAFVKQHAQEIDEAVMWQHIRLYVNQYTIDLNQEGRESIEFFIEYAIKNKIISQRVDPIFVN